MHQCLNLITAKNVPCHSTVKAAIISLRNLDIGEATIPVRTLLNVRELSLVYLAIQHRWLAAQGIKESYAVTAPTIGQRLMHSPANNVLVESET